MATLKGADANILLQVREKLPLMPGLVQLVLKLETLGWKVAIASGGFTFCGLPARQTAPDGGSGERTGDHGR